MPVNVPCAEYTEHAPAWEIIEDCIEGELAIKGAAETYLPLLYKEEKATYEARKDRASFFNGTRRTYEAWHGLITRKPPTVTSPEGMDAFAQDCTLTGQSFISFCDSVVGAVIKFARAGTLIDWHDEDKRPYLTHYCAEHIINWSTRSINGRPELALLVLEECSSEIFTAANETAESDEFTPPEFDQWRVFTLEQIDAKTYRVRMRLFRENAQKEGEFVVVEEKFPERRGAPLQRIPFVMHAAHLGNRYEVCPPPLLDIALLNLAHYRDSADLRNGLHIAGTPTPWAAGFTDDDDTELLLGVSTAWTSSDPNAKCGFLEFSGAGLQAIAADMTALESQMAALGARAMMPQKADAEAFQTVALRSSSETANLSSIAASASRTLTEVLQWAAFWMATNSTATPSDVADASVTYNTDLNTGGANPAIITALLQAFQSGAMSWETLFHNFAKAELYPEGRTLEDEQAAIETAAIAPPAPAPATKPPPGSNTPPGK